MVAQLNSSLMIVAVISLIVPSALVRSHPSSQIFFTNNILISTSISETASNLEKN